MIVDKEDIRHDILSNNQLRHSGETHVTKCVLTDSAQTSTAFKQRTLYLPFG
jgi:hypothetical protein